MDKKGKILKLVRRQVEENECVEIAKDLYDKCNSGEVTAFLAVSLDANNDVATWIGNGEADRKQFIHFLGAVWMLNHFIYDVMDGCSD